jgi:hypothetical protein
MPFINANAATAISTELLVMASKMLTMLYFGPKTHTQWMNEKCVSAPKGVKKARRLTSKS